MEGASGSLMDGQAAMARVVEVDLPDGAMRLIPIEELVLAGRRALAGSRIDPVKRSRAATLLALGSLLDRA